MNIGCDKNKVVAKSLYCELNIVAANRRPGRRQLNSNFSRYNCIFLVKSQNFKSQPIAGSKVGPRIRAFEDFEKMS